MPANYKEETFNNVLRWMADTEVSFVPFGKRPGTKSYDRYEKYRQGKTVAQVLDLGAKPEDLLHDFEKSLLTYSGGPIRDAPMKIENLSMDEIAKLTPTDMVLARWSGRAGGNKPAAEGEEETKDEQPPKEGKDKGKQARTMLKKVILANKYGVRPEELQGASWAESPEMNAARTKAKAEAVRILEACEAESRKVTHEEVLGFLRLWMFRDNRTRVDVMKEGVTSIACDRLGMMYKETRHIVSKETELYPEVLQLVSKLLRDHPPEGLMQDFPFTSVFVNSGYSAKRHRDKQNCGPTVVVSFGEFTGGRLEYWPDDDKRCGIDRLREEDKIQLDVKNTATIIDGNRVHSVEDFEGERFSLVFYTAERYHDTPAEVRKICGDMGVPFSTKESLDYILEKIPAPRGYGIVDVPKERKPPASCKPDEEGQGEAGGEAKGEDESEGKAKEQKPPAEPKQPKESKQPKEQKQPRKTDARIILAKRSLKVRPPAKNVFLTALRWTKDTRLQYVQDAKKGETKSAERYRQYQKAMSIGEALRLGAKPDDILHDYKRGHLQILGGAMRKEPLDPSSDMSNLNALEKHLLKTRVPGGSVNFRKTQAKLAKTLKMSKKLGIDLKEERHRVAGHESADMTAERAVADKMAKTILEATEKAGRRITDKELLAVLQFWAFKKNDTRQNVLPEGKTWVNSDTIGLVRSRTGALLASRPTIDYPNVARLLNRWLRARRPAEFEKEFPFTSISLNFGYAARRHRDGNNVGPSFIKAFGKFKGGTLGYWPDDDHSLPFEKLRTEDRVTLDLTKGLVLFDGCRAHEVDAFQGERFSIVYFCSGGWNKMPEDVKHILREREFTLPNNELVKSALNMLPKPRGHLHCASLVSLFGGEEGKQVQQWEAKVNTEEENEAAKLLVKLVKEVPDESAREAGQRSLMDSFASRSAVNSEGSSVGPATGAAPKDAPRPVNPIKAKRPAVRPVRRFAFAKACNNSKEREEKDGAAQPASPPPKAPADAGEATTTPESKQPRALLDGPSGVKRQSPFSDSALAPQKKAARTGEAGNGLRLMSDGLQVLLDAAKGVKGGEAALASELRPQLMQHMQEVLRFVATA